MNAALNSLSNRDENSWICKQRPVEVAHDEKSDFSLGSQIREYTVCQDYNFFLWS